MDDVYVAVLEKDCEPHYFRNSKNAMNYLIDNNDKLNCKLDPSNDNTCGELWDENGISIGYFYKISIED